MNHQIELQNASTDDEIPTGELSVWVSRAIEAAGREGDTEVSVKIVAADEMQELNRDYRQQDKPTNVLSFPAGVIDGLPIDAGVPLGDIVVCAAVVREEAALQNKPLAAHWAHMMIHGTLHLLGFDHQTDAEAVEMERIETQILTAHGMADPHAGFAKEN